MKILKKLLTVKSLVTLALTALVIVLALRGELPHDVLTIYTTIIAFYFGTQAEKAAAQMAPNNEKKAGNPGENNKED